MNRLLDQRGLLALILVVSGCLCFQLTSAQDVVFINETNLCVNGEESVPSGVSVPIVTNDSAVIRWNSVMHMPASMSGYEVLYWPTSSSSYETAVVADVNTEMVFIRDLRPYTRYQVVVRLYCSGDQVGLASPAVTFLTEAVEPSAPVTNLTARLTGDGEHEANISWNPLQAQDWNGIPFGYYVYVFTYSQDSMCGGTPIELMTFDAVRNATSMILPLGEHCYRVNVFPINHKAWGPESTPLYFTFTKFPLELKILSAEEVPQPTSEPPTPFLKSPYVYILVVGVVAVVPVVLGIVLCKKSKDRKDKVQYCRGIHGAPYGDVPMYPLSPSSAHLSPHAPSSRIQAFSPLSNPSPITPSRPLLSSPHGAGEYLQEGFPTLHSPTTPHFPQEFSPSGEGGRGGVSFTMRSEPASGGDVFVGSCSGPPPSGGAGPHRPRANTEGSGMHMPNPYEYPVHPGGASTLPRTAESGSWSHEVGGIPPPPSHAPPPLTQSSLEIFSRINRSPPHNGRSGGNHQRPTAGQRQGLPHRSFSTTHAGGPTSPTSTSAPSNSTRIIRSASQLHPVEENEPEGAGPDYATVDPPDNSLVQRKAATLPQQYVPNGSMRGMKRNSDDLSSFSEMTDDSVQLSTGQAQPLPPYHHAPRQPETGVYHMGEQRESVFSETSTEEPSISSGSIREASPTGAHSWVSGSLDGTDKKRLSSSSVTPTNSRSSHSQLYPTSPHS